MHLELHNLKRLLIGIAILSVPATILFLSPKQSSQLQVLKNNFLPPESIQYPAHNLYTEKKEELGKILFFDPRLSHSNMMSCASCHNPSFNWTDGLPKGIGNGHKELDRKVPTLINIATGWSFFWDGRANTLEEQALGPIQSEREMALKIPDLIEKLKGIEEYQTRFSEVFPEEGITDKTIGKAIATYERGIIFANAPFDSWIKGKENAISDSAKRGFVLFNEKANCVSCHTGWNFTNGSFADTGMPSLDLGRGAVVKNPALNFTFKTPTLRNISRRAPYMHDGSLKSLADVIEHYIKGGTERRNATVHFLKPLNLSQSEKADLIEFLGTLTENRQPVSIPTMPLAFREGK